MSATDRCANCGTVLSARYCGECGQDSTLALRPWRDLLAEWSDAVIGVETRTGRTLRALLLEPGRLTEEFAAGRRAAWIHPLRLYLGVSAVALAVFGATTGPIVAYMAARDGPSGILSQFGQLMLLVSATLFALMPLHAATYALAFRASRRFYAEHLVLVLHASAFLFIAEAAASLVQYLGMLLGAPTPFFAVIRMAAHAVTLAYGWSAVRRTYGLGVWPTLWRTTLAVSLFAPVFIGVVWLMIVLRR